MANTATLAIRIVSDATKAAKEIDVVSTKTSKMGRVSSAAGKALAVGIGGAVVAAVKFANAAAEDQQEAERLAHSLRTAAGATDKQVASTEKWIEAQGRALGVSDSELRPALAKLAIATGDVGKAQRLAALAMNISAGSGKSLESVSQALAKAQNGSVAGLSKLGIKTKESVADTVALKSAKIAVISAENAYKKAVEDSGKGSAAAAIAAKKLDLAQIKLGEAHEKTKTSTISAEEAIKRLRDAYQGSAAKAADTVAGKQKILKVRMDELQEAIGARLLPVLNTLVGVGLTVVGWMERNQTTALVLVGALGALLAVVASVNLLTKAYTATTAAWTAVTAVASKVQTGFKDATIGTRIQLAALKVQQVVMTVATKAWSAALKVAAVAQRIFNAAMRANPIGLIITAIALLIAGLVLAYKKSATFRAIVDAVGKAGKAAFGWIIDKVTALVNLIKDKAGPAFDAFKSAAVGVGNAIIAPFKALWDLIQKIIDLIKKIPSPGGGIPFVDGIRTVAQTGSGFPFGAVPTFSGGGGSVVVNINGGFVDDATLDKLTKAIDRRSRRRGA